MCTCMCICYMNVYIKVCIKADMNKSVCVYIDECMNYLLSTWKNYSLTAQHVQDCLIFFIQLKHAYKLK